MATTTATLIQPPKDQEWEAEKLTTPSGKEFSIGRPKGSSAGKAKNGPALSHGGSFTVACSPTWIAGGSGNTTQDFINQTGITQWAIAVGGLIYNYRLYFWCNETYDYQFQDATQQWYECNVYIPGVHYIDYNSDSPNIVQVSGS